mgnify:CR=1 FL=1
MRGGFFSFLIFTTTDGKSGRCSKHFIKFLCYAKCRLYQFDFKDKYHGGILHNGVGLGEVAEPEAK